MKTGLIKLVAFDMDSTLIEAEVIDELAKAAGVGAEVSAITELAMAGELDFTQSFKRRVGLLKGLDESVLEGIARTVWRQPANRQVTRPCLVGPGMRGSAHYRL